MQLVTVRPLLDHLAAGVQPGKPLAIETVDLAGPKAGGATAFIVHVALSERSGDLVLRMSEEGAANAIRFARDSCGLG